MTATFFSFSDPAWYGKSLALFRGSMISRDSASSIAATRNPKFFAIVDPILFNVVEASLGRV